MKVESTKIPEVLIIIPEIHGDDRGFFLESFNKKDFDTIGISAEFVQDNHSKSSQGVIRGLHYQKNYPQGKLIRVFQGEVLDVALDIRKGSPTFAAWVAVIISSENKKQLWVPPGFAHGFSVLSATAEFFYKVTDYYHPEDEMGVRWNDPELNIDWQVASPLLSSRDENLPLLQDAGDDLPDYDPSPILSKR